ncbi:serine protease [Treponema vincentii]|uniref:S1C family serine protease n=1 Tax=Treponema vincentii TaxID=69710 RepID=UPI001BB0368E|nr:S1C family serine protease [Treponema vincentii]QUY17944.1 serine protease [Treponema vincentii]
MRLSRFSFNIYALIVLVVTFDACTSVTPSFSQSVDYTDGRSVTREIEAVRALIAEKPLDALLRAKRLTLYTESTGETNTLYQESKSAVEALFFKDVENGEWEDALKLFRSLTALGEAPVQWTEQKLVSAQRNKWKEKKFDALIQATARLSDGGHDAPSLETVRKMMKGTVTVWVDRGMTIKKGLGMADRMIGSGFFIDANGYLITNYHVIQSEVDPEYEGFSRVYIKRAENPTVRIPAKVVGWDTIFDLALLKTEINPEVYFQLGSSEDLNIGSRIYAIGSPAGLEQTLTSGIVSAQNRRLLSLGSVLQIDAPVNHGSSGGPIIDEAGRVQAIVFAGLERNEGLNFAIPVELLRLILPQLYAGGETVHAWMSCYGVSVKESPQQEAGTELVYAVPGSSASVIPAGAVITHLNGRAVPSLEALQTELMRLATGTIVKISGYAPLHTSAASGVLSHGTGTDAAGSTGNRADSTAPDAIGNSGNSEAGIAHISTGDTVGTTSEAAGNMGGAEQREHRWEKTRQDWYVQLEARPKQPAEQVYRKDSRARAMLPVYGIYLESAGGKKSFRITEVIPGSYADETGFSAGDYLEIHKMEVQKAEEALFTRIYTKRRKSAYLDTFMDIWAYLDNPSYF